MPAGGSRVAAAASFVSPSRRARYLSGATWASSSSSGAHQRRIGVPELRIPARRLDGGRSIGFGEQRQERALVERPGQDRMDMVVDEFDRLQRRVDLGVRPVADPVALHVAGPRGCLRDERQHSRRAP